MQDYTYNEGSFYQGVVRREIISNILFGVCAMIRTWPTLVALSIQSSEDVTSAERLNSLNGRVAWLVARLVVRRGRLGCRAGPGIR